MTTFENIRALYDLTEAKDTFGYKENELVQLENELKINLPKKIREYYLSLGKHEQLNSSHNRLLKPTKEIGFSEDQHLIFYEENQASIYWGIKEQDLHLDNPKVWGNYGTIDKPDWHIEAKTTGAFFLLMAVYNGTLGGLEFNANSFGNVSSQVVKFISNNWEAVPEISWDKQRIYTRSFKEVISLSFDEKDNCTALFVGTSDQARFDILLDTLNVSWSYTSYDENEL